MIPFSKANILNRNFQLKSMVNDSFWYLTIMQHRAMTPGMELEWIDIFQQVLNDTNWTDHWWKLQTNSWIDCEIMNFKHGHKFMKYLFSVQWSHAILSTGGGSTSRNWKGESGLFLTPVLTLWEAAILTVTYGGELLYLDLARSSQVIVDVYFTGW